MLGRLRHRTRTRTYASTVSFVSPSPTWRRNEFFGKSRAELSGKTLDDLFPAIAGTPLEDAYRRAMSERAAVTLENYCEAEQRWYSITASPDADGGIVVRFSDVTDRKRIEMALRKSEEKFFKAFQSSPVPMCIVDVGKNSSFLEVNESFERITGFHHDEIIGRTSTELGLYVEPRDFEESRKRMLADGGYRNLEFHFRKKNGEIIVGLISAEQIEIDGNFCAIAIAVDVTESRRAEQAHRESEELYRQLFELESDAIVLVDRESGQLLAANAGGLEPLRLQPGRVALHESDGPLGGGGKDRRGHHGHADLHSAALAQEEERHGLPRGDFGLLF